MYNNLFFGLKRRMLEEIEEAFLDHPSFSQKVRVYNRFPYEERIQYGCILKSTSSSQIRLSADNYMAEHISHVRLARDRNNPGNSIEWARENAIHITHYEENEDVSSQLSPTQRLFYTSKPILAGFGDTKYATATNQVLVKINDTTVIPDFVDGKRRMILLSHPIEASDVVKVSYYYRYIDLPGIYVIDFTSDSEFIVCPLYIIEKEIVIEGTTGFETEAYLLHTGVYSGTDILYLESFNGGSLIQLIRERDYTISDNHITFLTPIPKNKKLVADYRYQTGDSRGPYTFRPYQENHDAIQGVIISIGRRAKAGDRHVVIVSQNREVQARIYGGHWDMSLGIIVVSKDSIQVEEMADQLINHLWSVQKNLMEYEGITLNSVDPTGESEQSHIESTGDLYYESSIDIRVMTEWQRFVPYLYKIGAVTPNLYASIQGLNSALNQNGDIIYETDTREVIVHPTIGFERVI